LKIMTIATGTPSSAPGFDVASLESSSGFVKAAGLVLDEISESKVTGHIDLASEHHTPWGIVHGGVYSTAVESAASIGASAAVVGRGLVAVGLTNTTHFLRSLTGGRVNVEAAALYQGRTHQLWRADITDASGRLVAHGEVRLQNIAPNPKE
jgi:1,4-dihydroxy-2-naphthoyl-CoA hydrolase